MLAWAVPSVCACRRMLGSASALCEEALAFVQQPSGTLGVVLCSLV